MFFFHWCYCSKEMVHFSLTALGTFWYSLQKRNDALEWGKNKFAFTLSVMFTIYRKHRLRCLPQNLRRYVQYMSHVFHITDHAVNSRKHMKWELLFCRSEPGSPWSVSWAPGCLGHENPRTSSSWWRTIWESATLVASAIPQWGHHILTAWRGTASSWRSIWRPPASARRAEAPSSQGGIQFVQVWNDVLDLNDKILGFSPKFMITPRIHQYRKIGNMVLQIFPYKLFYRGNENVKRSLI